MAEPQVGMRIQMNLLDVLAAQCAKDSKEWFPEAANAASTNPEELTRALIHHSLAMCGEVGEVANLVKKVDRGTVDITNIVFQNDIHEELTDVFIYLLNLVALLKIDLLKEYMKKRDKNVKRFSRTPQNGARA